MCNMPLILCLGNAGRADAVMRTIGALLECPQELLQMEWLH